MKKLVIATVAILALASCKPESETPGGRGWNVLDWSLSSQWATDKLRHLHYTIACYDKNIEQEFKDRFCGHIYEGDKK